jgi:hypothetical protein
MTHRLELAVVAVLCGICTGCGNEFDDTRVRLVTEGSPIQLDSEQVTLSYPQVDCGVDKDLWDAPVQVSERSVAHLKQAGRDLGFNDDVSLNEPGYNQPYAQMRGKFMLRVENILDTRDGPGQGAKTVQLQVRVKVPNECFGGDLPIMGIRKGQFNPGTNPSLVYQLGSDGWYIDHFVH